MQCKSGVWCAAALVAVVSDVGAQSPPPIDGLDVVRSYESGPSEASASPPLTPSPGTEDPGRGLSVCSDGTLLDVNTYLGTLGPGRRRLAQTTLGHGKGICGYAYFGAPVGRIETGSEFIYQFRVDRNMVAWVVNYELSPGTNQDHYLLNGTFLFFSDDIHSLGLNAGIVADDCIGYADEYGAMLDANGEQRILVPNTDYYFVVDSYANQNGPFDVELFLMLPPCSDASGLTTDFNVGPLDTGSHRLTGSTVPYGPGVCAYTDDDREYPVLGTGNEVVYTFWVNERVRPSIINREGIGVGTNQNHYLMEHDGLYLSYDVFDLGIASGVVAIGCIGFVDEQGGFVDTESNETVLHAGTIYRLVVDSYEGQNGFYDIDLVLTRAPCNAADVGYPAGVNDFTDVLVFLSAFAAQDPLADLATPFGVYDFSDVLAFLVAFAAACE